MKPAHKPPSAKTLRQLYVLSGNLCAKPGCATVLVNANGRFVGAVCHIKGERPGAARFDKSLTEEKRRAQTNLILLCSTHHTLVDAEPKKYTVGVLSKWKQTRERHFAAVGDTLRQRYMDEIADEAKATDLTKPQSLKSFIKFLEGHPHTIDANTPGKVSKYVGRLRHLAMPDRDLMTAIIERALDLGGSGALGEYGVSVHPDDLKTILINKTRLSDYRIQKLGKTLERNDLGSLDVDEEPRLFISAPDEDLTWSDIKRFLESRGNELRDVVCDLKFGLLD
jgi:hypothetical protein